MAKYPSEIFGFYWRDESQKAKEARKKYWCPFHNSKCFKKSRLIKYPFGVCTAHFDGDEIALCPRRFIENFTVFRDIAKLNFGTCDNILVFSEVGLSGIGNFDFIMVKHTPMRTHIEDFAVVEFQTGQTTSTGRLVDGFNDFVRNGTLEDGSSYNFGINMYDIWKRTFTQILNKGIILEKWNRKIFWIVQDQIFNYFQHKYRLQELTYDANHSTVFALYDLKRIDNRLVLTETRTFSSTIDDLFDGFRKNDDIPPVEKFIDHLESKISKDLKSGLQLETDDGSHYIDAHKPSSTGRIRDQSGNYFSKDKQKNFFD